ncbi:MULTISPECIES: YihY family inner membrane protein [Campylobacter]|uniref:Virulence factor, BrkB family protein n=1 Tax=Campylobacter porcelli TaxID=1660073 RepID=A0A1X9SVH7_9BACT|nr:MULTISPECIES: YihY family inner membrane protein [unclassified Campylobacter]MCR8679187.1 YihY family inner membrane protein [Campylobacter sp. RM19072]MCR8696693.1 YihY family inner membrane protein [Campylobacter sp. RM19073]MEE3705164.1 YihY family inner membrane protein [Campylobacter sp. CX2-8023-23]MEE3744785.1 YihY family inner membrane protein [Campylobacter sp. CX2-4855-23]MEE3777109.1 YihY family inner membrane protein [Campylobacter sp. CX2-4080-23]
MANIKDIVKIVAKELSNKELFHFAASLSFHTLLSIIPIIFVSLSIFTTMPSFKEYYIKIKDFIYSNLLPSQNITQYLDQFLNNSSSLGIMGVVAILFTSLLFFAEYDYAISTICDTQKRKFWQGLSNYWTLITLMPLGLGLSFWLSNSIQTALKSSEYTSWINFLAIFPYIIIWAIFAITYIISINRNLSIKSIAISSFISSLAWSVSKWLFIEYSFYNKTYASIYGSFSIILFFILWIYISWIIFLHGIKLCYAIENTKFTKNQ